jgi:hypothetical protein
VQYSIGRFMHLNKSQPLQYNINSKCRTSNIATCWGCACQATLQETSFAHPTVAYGALILVLLTFPSNFPSLCLWQPLAPRSVNISIMLDSKKVALPRKQLLTSIIKYPPMTGIQKYTNPINLRPVGLRGILKEWILCLSSSCLLDSSRK